MANLISLVVPNFLTLWIGGSVGLPVVLDQQLVGAGQLGGLGVGGSPDGGVEHAEEPDDQTDDALSVKLEGKFKNAGKNIDPCL